MKGCYIMLRMPTCVRCCSSSWAPVCRRFAVGEVRVMELLRRAGERPPPGDLEALSFWVRPLRTRCLSSRACACACWPAHPS